MALVCGLVSYNQGCPGGRDPVQVFLEPQARLFVICVLGSSAGRQPMTSEVPQGTQLKASSRPIGSVLSPREGHRMCPCVDLSIVL